LVTLATLGLFFLAALDVLVHTDLGWPPFRHESIGHEPLIAFEQWKASKHRSLWLVVSNRDVVNRDTSQTCLFPSILERERCTY